MKKFKFRIKRANGVYFNNFKIRSLKNVFSNIAQKTFKKALIIGAGDCAQAEMLLPYCEKIICTELDDTIKNRISTKNIIYMQVDAENLRETFGNEKFDLIYSSNVLEHLPNVEKTIKDIEFLLTDNGISINYMPNRLWKLCHIFLYTISKLSDAIDTNVLFSAKKLKELFEYDNNHNNLNLDRKYKFGIKNYFIPISTHGVSKNHLQEFVNFGANIQKKKFEKIGLKPILTSGTTFSSGYMFGYELFQELFELLNIFPENVYILKKQNCKKAIAEEILKKGIHKSYPALNNLLFSIKKEYSNHKEHKVISILGIKIKLKTTN